MRYRYFGTLGESLANLGDYHLAVGYFERLRELEPNNPDAINNLAICFKELGDIAKAQNTMRNR